jgi:hypothetical protein
MHFGRHVAICAKNLLSDVLQSDCEVSVPIFTIRWVPMRHGIVITTVPVAVHNFIKKIII